MSGPGAVLRARGLHPKKRFGQNFLCDEGMCRRIAAAATTPEGGTVVEIGPGLGALTRPLLARAARVVAIERDRDLEAILREELVADIESGRLELIEADALDTDWRALVSVGLRPRAIAGNLPYLVTGRLLERAVELADDVDVAVFMVQAEVAQRLLASPGTGEYGALTVFVRAAYAVDRLLVARGGAFFPRPEVDSAVVVLTPLRPRRAVEDEPFRALVRGAFGMRRKTLRNAWRGLFGWSTDDLARHAATAGISLDARGETLSVDDFERLAAIVRGAS